MSFSSIQWMGITMMVSGVLMLLLSLLFPSSLSQLLSQLHLTPTAAALISALFIWGGFFLWSRNGR